MTFQIQATHVAMLFCLTMTLALFPVSQTRAMGAEGVVGNDVDGIEEAVVGFYEKYLTAIKNNMELDLKEQQEIHPALAKKIENLFQEAEKTEPGFLGYDPILMAQDTPIRLEYDMAGVDTPFAAMLVHKVWDENNKNSLCVYLYKENGQRHINGWRIFEITDLSDPENPKECNAFESNKLLKELTGV